MGLGSLGVSVVLAACAAPSPQEAPIPLADELRAAVAIAAPRERRAAAIALAKRKDASVPALLAAIELASTRDTAPTGPRVEHVTLHADGKPEETEIVLYVPRSYDATRPVPLIGAFHGTGASGVGLDTMWGVTSEALGAIVVAPGEAGPNEGYAFSKRERDAACEALRFACTRYLVDPDRVYGTGVSRGGHLTWDFALRRPDRFAALAPMIGCPRFQIVRGQNNLRFLENLVNVPIRDLQGSKDDPGVLQNLHEAFARLTDLHALDAKLIEFPERGHDFEFGAVDWPKFFGAAQRDPMPQRVVFTSANEDEARAFWVEIVQFTKDVVENPRLDVPAAEWAKLDAAGQRRFVQERIDRGTARIVATRTGKGRFTVEAKGVAKFRLLLASEMFDPATPVEVTFQGKVTKRKLALDPRLLATEYVERLDRSFLPVASIELP